ncbi:hypothetical protein [Tsuneonella suprasediminis]|uniref:hypothetical protein n=1 Tax=Tsuneonella suprasediminis TaxID=2306996 RepID=UPI002F943076
MQNGSQAQTEKLKLLGEAISRRQIIEASFNGGFLRLAPHQVFVRREALYLAAFNGEKSCRYDEESAFGGYNLAGFSGVSVTDQTSEPLSYFDQAGTRLGDPVLLTIETDVGS